MGASLFQIDQSLIALERTNLDARLKKLIDFQKLVGAGDSGEEAASG